MKHAYSFLAGVALVSLCVVATRSLPGWMFLVGFGVSVISHVLLVRAIGCSKVARLFSYLDSFRLAPHWSSGAKQLCRVPSNRAELLVKVPCGQRIDPGPDSWLLNRSAEETLGSKPERPSSPTNELRPCRNPNSARNGKCRSVVNSVEMLSSVHQDVLSALCNLKVPFAEAQEAVLAAGKDGQSFDELFKTALAHVNAGVGKSRRAA